MKKNRWNVRKMVLCAIFAGLASGLGSVIAISGSGADGVAVVSAILAAADPGQAAKELLALSGEMVAHG